MLLPCNLLIVDTETTGIDPSNNEVIELGAILYSVAHQTVVQQMSSLFSASSNPAEKINRIPSSILPLIREDLEESARQMFKSMVNEANFFVAHNADFDKQWFLQTEGARFYLRNEKSQEDLPWLCTMNDFTWPNQVRSGESLVNLALNHGIGVSSAHRALTDCQLIAALFDRLSKAELLILLTEALEPRYWYKALVSYEDRHQAKDLDFRWDSVQKIWKRKMTEKEGQSLPFHVHRIDVVVN